MMKEKLTEILDEHRGNTDAPITKESYEWLYKSLLSDLLDLEKEEN
ncbi:hypothetical protein [Enterococcus raffinosus]|uniref:Uncharacterized protein n=1 Tax=Enterococcus raffinosus TaxID=71452 RepID=A0AAW8TB45_9ENTE|nr:hypothetical protein [Enterococcus raffinosus]MDT2545809.1 hypothetical protein [Enterococcus raffinosus]MDT2579063.1 hypothetical protein [Enterococcus raffinosus]QZO07903.1 hypothetical protein K5P74_08365 [Enterococcus raffinosus]